MRKISAAIIIHPDHFKCVLSHPGDKADPAVLAIARTIKGDLPENTSVNNRLTTSFGDVVGVQYFWSYHYPSQLEGRCLSHFVSTFNHYGFCAKVVLP